MPEQLLNYINQYGYLLLFTLVFLQEIGVPSFPNEIVLYYFGYMASQNNFNLILVLLVAITADIIGTSLLYFAFYFFGKVLMKYKPTWIKIDKQKLKAIKSKLISRKSSTIFFLRMTPFLRGYISVFAGMMHFPFKVYFKQIVVTAILWTGSWVVLGCITNDYFRNTLNFVKDNKDIIILIMITFIILFLSKYFIKFFNKKELEKVFKIN